MHLNKQRLSALIVFLLVLGSLLGTGFAADKKADDILAEIGDKKITRQDFETELDTFLQKANPQAAAHFAKPEGKKMFLSQIAEIYTLEKEAIKKGLNKGEKFEKDCKEMSKGALASQYIENLMTGIKADKKEIEKFYNENKKAFTDPSQFHLHQITVAKKEDAAAIKKELDGGKSFLEIAKAKSSDSFNKAGGDRGFVSELGIDPTLLAVVGQLKKDQVSAPVKMSDEKFVLVKFSEKKEGELKELKAVEAKIERDLVSKKQKAKYESAMSDLKKELGFELKMDSAELLRKESLTEADKEKVLLKVAGKEIKVGELEAEMQQIPPFIRPQILKGQGLVDFINQFSYRNLAFSYVEKNLEKLSKEFPKVTEEVARRTSIRYLLDNTIGAIKLSDKDIEEYYNKNLKEFASPAQMQAHHILVKEEKDAKQIFESLQKDSKKFEEIAKEKSLCPSGKTAGGDLGKFGEGQMVPEFDKVCQTAEIGKIVGPVKTQFGYHIIRVDSREKAGTKKFEEVKDSIRSKLLPAKQKEAFTKLIEGLKKEYKVKIYQERL